MISLVVTKPDLTVARHVFAGDRSKSFELIELLKAKNEGCTFEIEDDGNE